MGEKVCESLGEMLGWTCRHVPCHLQMIPVAQLVVQHTFPICFFLLSAFLLAPTCLAKRHLLSNCFCHQSTVFLPTRLCIRAPSGLVPFLPTYVCTAGNTARPR